MNPPPSPRPPLKKSKTEKCTAEQGTSTHYLINKKLYLPFELKNANIKYISPHESISKPVYNYTMGALCKLLIYT